jgi:hypothetical protein
MVNIRCGRDLCQSFYEEHLRPALAGVRHDAALIGEGSDVLGYDQNISRDHNWGVRATIFVDDIREAPALALPEEYRGSSVKPENIVITTIGEWLAKNLGIGDVHHIPMAKWLSMPQQLLLQFVGGAQLGGDLGAYRSARELLAWYPDDIWRWMMAAQWYFIWSEERLIPRTRDAGDLIGAQMIAHRLLRYIFQMHFLQCKRHQPYDKWFGTAFGRLDGHEFFEGRFRDAMSADLDGQIEILHDMLIRLGEGHNALGLTRQVEPRICNYEVGIDGAVRPYRIINASDYIEALKESIGDMALRELPTVGAIDQLGNTTDIMINFSHWKPVFEVGYDQGLK